MELSKKLLQKKLIACANILSPCQSLYVWKLKLSIENEFPVFYKLLKSQEAKFKKEILKDIYSKLPILTTSKKNVLDIGCGATPLTLQLIKDCGLKNHQLFLMDSPEMLSIRKNSRLLR